MKKKKKTGLREANVLGGAVHNALPHKSPILPPRTSPNFTAFVIVSLSCRARQLPQNFWTCCALLPLFQEENGNYLCFSLLKLKYLEDQLLSTSKNTATKKDFFQKKITKCLQYDLIPQTSAGYYQQYCHVQAVPTKLHCRVPTCQTCN